MGSVAPLVSSWARRPAPGYVYAPAPTRGSAPAPQGPTDPIGLGAEIYLGGLGWTDISPFVLYRDSSQFVSIGRGRPNEASSTVSQPQTCQFQLNNRSNQFSPRNPAGPYFQLIGRNTPIRFWRMQNGIRRYRFAGEVVEWPSTADLSGTDVWTSVTAAGMLRRLSQGTAPTFSSMYRAFMKVGGLPNVVAYWPCEDGASAQQIASALSGGSPMKVVGSPAFAGDSSFGCSKALPVLKSSTWSAPVPSGVTWTDNVVRFLVKIPSGGDTNGAVVARYYTTGTVARVDLIYNTASNGTFTIAGYNAAGVQTTATIASPGPDGSGFNGVLAHVSMDLRTGISGVTAQVNTVSNGTEALSGSALTLTVGAVQTVVIDPNANLAGTVVGHVSVQNVEANMVALLEPLQGWNFDSAPGRLERLCVEEGVNQVSVYGDDPNDASLMGFQDVDTFLNLVQQCADVDAGTLFEARDQVALVYRERFTLYNQGTAYGLSPFQLTLDFAQNQLSAQPQPQDDDAYARNDVTVAQLAGSSARQVLNDGSALSISPPPAGAGEYATTYTINIGPDGQFAGQMSIADHAGWRLHLGTVNEARYPQVSVNLRHPTFTGSLDLMNAALSVDVGDVIVLNNPPARLGPDPIRLVILGHSETMGTWEHDIVFNCAPESPYRVMVLDDPVLGRADTDGSTLAAAYPLGTETTLLVATANANSPLWTTSAGDFPFDVAVGGERMTVTDVTGASSPQAFTVTRSVNGIIKSQTAGTDIRLFQPAILSL
jgi:hypothetical protein